MTFVNSTKLSAMALAWENLPGGFCDVGCCCFYFTGYFYVFGLLFFPTDTPPWLLRHMKASSSSELCPGYFWLLYFCQAFLSQLYHERYCFWVRVFCPQAFFTLCSFTDIFGTFLWLRWGKEQPFQDPPLCLSSQSHPFWLIYGLELLML